MNPNEIAEALFIRLIESPEFESLTPEQREQALMHIVKSCADWVLDRNDF